MSSPSSSRSPSPSCEFSLSPEKPKPSTSANLNAAAKTFAPQSPPQPVPSIPIVGTVLMTGECFPVQPYDNQYLDVVEEVFTMPTSAPAATGFFEETASSSLSELQLKKAEADWEKAKVEKETLALRLEIEQLKLELNTLQNCKVKVNEGGVDGVDGEGVGGGNNGEKDSEAEATAEEEPVADPEAVVGKKIIAFIRLTKNENMPWPHRLYGKNNYSMWRESILSCAEAAECGHILDNGEKVSPFGNENDFLWDQQNDWLYDLIWDSISAKAIDAVTPPKRHSAYMLWNHLESTFRLPLEEERRALFRGLYPTQQNVSDREYIKEFQDARRKLEKLGFPVPDWLLYDILYEGVSEQSRNTIQNNLELRRETMPKHLPQTLEIDVLIDELVTCLPHQTEHEHEHDTGAGNDSAGNDSGNDSGNGSNDSNENNAALDSPALSIISTSNRSSSNNSTDTRNTGNNTPSTKTSTKGGSNGNNTSNGTNNKSSNNTSNIKCEYCGRWGHTPSNCFYNHPEMASEHWRNRNAHGIEFFRNRQLERQSSKASEKTWNGHGRGKGKGKGSSPERSSSVPANANMTQSIRAIARQFYDQMDKEV
ncbi:hypothetical protein FQN50_006691 [Emmonsiellopsis sp. PD_5]|nr:hypothetical protein FQN50_006691 [Emmonsiellopsis sp. PD_5]